MEFYYISVPKTRQALCCCTVLCSFALLRVKCGNKNGIRSHRRGWLLPKQLPRTVGWCFLVSSKNRYIYESSWILFDDGGSYYTGGKPFLFIICHASSMSARPHLPLLFPPIFFEPVICCTSCGTWWRLSDWRNYHSALPTVFLIWDVRPSLPCLELIAAWRSFFFLHYGTDNQRHDNRRIWLEGIGVNENVICRAQARLVEQQ